MPWTAEERKVYMKAYSKEYWKANREKLSKQSKEYHDNNKVEIMKKHKEYRDSHKKESKEYSQTPEGKKSKRIRQWEMRGLICEDTDTLYEKYLNTTNCDNCDVELTVDRHNTSTTRMMDHDHETGLFRNVLCLSCNTKRR